MHTGNEVRRSSVNSMTNRVDRPVGSGLPIDHVNGEFGSCSVVERDEHNVPRLLTSRIRYSGVSVRRANLVLVGTDVHTNASRDVGDGAQVPMRPVPRQLLPYFRQRSVPALWVVRTTVLVTAHRRAATRCIRATRVHPKTGAIGVPTIRIALALRTLARLTIRAQPARYRTVVRGRAVVPVFLLAAIV